MKDAKNPHIVIVGGGAGGLELAVLLGKRLGKKKVADITLVNDIFTHIWKPLLHELAAGTLDSHEDELNYFAIARNNYFDFKLGRMIGINHDQKRIILKADFNHAIQYELQYDFLILAIGSISNDFNIPGVTEHCLSLDSRLQAEHFHQSFLNYFLELSYTANARGLGIVIIGGDATGVELAAELHYAGTRLSADGLHLPLACSLKITLIEAGERLLSALPEKMTLDIVKELENRGINILTEARVAEVRSEGVRLSNGKLIPAQIKVWAAGIKAPEFLQTLGLKTNRLNQLVVKDTLQTVDDSHIFAFGDCAACPMDSDSTQLVPPRAQAAHQQAALLTKSFERIIHGKAALRFKYRDYGSLISISRYNTIGRLMNQRGLSIGVEGTLAKWFYQSLYKQHQANVIGWRRTILLRIAKAFSGPAKPKLKLH